MSAPSMLRKSSSPAATQSRFEECSQHAIHRTSTFALQHFVSWKDGRQFPLVRSFDPSVRRCSENVLLSLLPIAMEIILRLIRPHHNQVGFIVQSRSPHHGQMHIPRQRSHIHRLCLHIRLPRNRSHFLRSHLTPLCVACRL